MTRSRIAIGDSEDLHRQAAVDVDRAAVEVVALEHELHAEPESSGRPMRPTGIMATRPSRAFWFIPWVIGVSIIAGGDRADADAERGELERPGLRVRREGSLRGGVVRLTTVAVAGDARHVHDDARTLSFLGHRPDAVAGEEGRAGEVHGDDGVPLLLRRAS